MTIHFLMMFVVTHLLECLLTNLLTKCWQFCVRRGEESKGQDGHFHSVYVSYNIGTNTHSFKHVHSIDMDTFSDIGTPPQNCRNGIEGYLLISKPFSELTSFPRTSKVKFILVLTVFILDFRVLRTSIDTRGKGSYQNIGTQVLPQTTDNRYFPNERVVPHTYHF